MTTASYPTHGCPGGCGVQVPMRHLACPGDWARLPHELRDLVNDTYRTLGRTHDERDRRAHWEALRLARHWYRDNPRSVG